MAVQLALVGPSLNMSQQPWSQLGYLHHASTQDEVKGISHWVIADLDSQVLASPCTAFAFIQFANNPSSFCMFFANRFTCLLSPVCWQEGQKLVLAALGHLESEASQGARVALVHNPTKAKISWLAGAVTAASRLQTRRPKIVPFLRTLLESHQGAMQSLLIPLTSPQLDASKIPSIWEYCPQVRHRPSTHSHMPVCLLLLYQVAHYRIRC